MQKEIGGMQEITALQQFQKYCSKKNQMIMLLLVGYNTQ